MDTSIVVAGIAAAVSAGTAVLTFRLGAVANAANAKKVDLEEHRDALARLRQIIDEQDKHIERVRTQLDRVQEQLAREQDVSMALRVQIRSLQNQVDELMRSRGRLEDMLTGVSPSLRDKEQKE